MSVSSPATADHGGAPPQPTPALEPVRTIAPRRSLPGSRAIAGGILVAVSVLGTFALATGATKDGTQPVVVATRDLAPGTRLQPGDVRVEQKVMSAGTGRNLHHTTKSVVGATVLGPVREGEFLQNGNVAPATSQTAYIEVSFAVPSARALDGTLRPGETVDVLSTDKSSPLAVAHVAATNARVLRTQANGGGGIGRSGDVTITVGVISKVDASAIAAAVDQGPITLVRTTGITQHG